MSSSAEVVVTGVGVVSPIGIGKQAFWASLLEGRSGVRQLSYVNGSHLPVHIGAEVLDFDPAKLVKPRKSLKVMSRDIQLAYVAADLACQDAGLAEGTVDPERLGVVLGADMIQVDPADVAAAFRQSLAGDRVDMALWAQRGMPEIYPLWFLKLLPNMPACHIGIAHDARGPTNSITLGEVSGLLAISEAAQVICRGQADVVIAGGTGTRVHPTLYARSFASQLAPGRDGPTAASRPFELGRSGFVNGEGAAAFVLESRRHAEAGGRNVISRVLSAASTFEPRRAGRPFQGTAIRAAIRRALQLAGLAPRDVGHVNANGLATTDDDRVEAHAIRDVLADVPVTAPKSFFGTLGSGTGAVELAASVLALAADRVPVTLNYLRPDPHCPVQVIHGQPLAGAAPSALVLNHAVTGQSAAVIIAGPR